MKLAVKVTPRAKSDGIGGLVDTPDGKRLEVRLHAMPADGEANAALIRLIAKFFGLRQADVEIMQGGASRLKRLSLKGDETALADILNRHLEQHGA